jgi:ribosomal protein S17E
MDLSGVLGIAGKTAKVSGAARMAKGLEKASSAIDPMSQGINALGAVAKKASPLASRTRNELLGMSTGAGPVPIERAVVGTPAFKEGMRGKITGDEIVENAREALESIKEKRSSEYRSQLEELTDLTKDKASKAAQIDMSPIRDKAKELYERYNVKRMGNVGPHANFDLSRVPMGKKGIRDIKEIIDKVQTWGTNKGGKKGDNSALGLDTLKRQLDDFYSDSSQARGFVAELRDAVHKTISDAVPEYANMTKGYQEASTLIKDIQKTLMLQTGNSQRTADQVLRRLTSAMKERFELRKDLIDVLGKEGSVNLTDRIAGYSMSNTMPKGLVSRIHLGGAAALAHWVNPMLWPALAASSPRVMGEFLTAYGNASRIVKASKSAIKSASKMSGIKPPSIPKEVLTQGAFQGQRLANQERQEE